MPYTFSMRSITLARTGSLVLVSFTLSSAAFAANFNDIGSSSNKTAILYLSDNGVIKGYSDGSFKPNDSINRAELSKILVTATHTEPGLDQYNRCFSDVGMQWFASYICYAKAQGWVKGYADGTFKPGNPVNTAEALKMILNAQNIAPEVSVEFNTYTDVDSGAWFAAYVETANAKGLLEKKSGKLGIGANITRGMVAETIYRAITRSGDSSFSAVSSAHSSQRSFPFSHGSSSSSAWSQSQAVIDVKRKYRDGTYSAAGNYVSPAGPELVNVSLTLKDDVIVEASFQATSSSEKSTHFQQLFADGFKEEVAGKPIDDLALTVVNGSSLTPKGFMDALRKIQVEALH